MERVILKVVIKKAIENEEVSFRFYMDLLDIVEDKTSKDTLKFLAEQELSHKEILQKYQNGQFKEGALELDTVIDGRVVETFGAPKVSAEMDQKDVFLIAAEREKASYEFYERLAQLHPEGELKSLFMKLANEELKHKEKAEYLYCNAAFPQTAGG